MAYETSTDDVPPEAPHDALVALHGLAGSLGGVQPGAVPGFRAASPATALRAVADASLDELPVSARVHVLHSLAKRGFPHYAEAKQQYQDVAASVAQARGIDADQLLSDVKAAALGDAEFHTTASGQGLPHHEAAFVGKEICTTRKVEVGALRGTWVYSEFSTDAPFDGVADWVDPRSWPKRGPMMFKRMQTVDGGEPVPIKDGMGTEHWHSVFHEEVQLVRRLNTLLHCDFWRDGDKAAGMTYDLSLSLDNEIDVDRGFLLVVNEGPVRRVKALKIVGFTQDVWDEVADMVCPFWTDWVRSAVEGGKTSTPHGTTPATGSADGADRPPTRDQLDSWVSFFGEAFGVYAEMFDTVADRVAGGTYGTKHLNDDMQTYWTQIAKDWSQAWSYGLQAWQDVATKGWDASLAPPDAEPDTAPPLGSLLRRSEAATARREATTLAVNQQADPAGLRVPELRSIEAGAATIPSSDIVVSTEAQPDGTVAVRVATTNTVVPAGLYIGLVEDATGQPVSPVQLYVSRALRENP